MASERSCALPVIEAGVELGPLNTFGLAARAERLARITDPAQVAALAAGVPAWATMPRFVLGGGSNVILTRDVPGVVLKVEIAGRRLVGEDESAWYVEAGGGENWHAFVRWTLAQGWPGLENLSLIPGTVGAAPVQNIGAYGVELAERFHCLRALRLDSGEGVELDRAACRFAYRDSVFKRALAGKLLIAAVTFRLPKRWMPVTAYGELERELGARGARVPAPQEVSDAVIAIRQRKLPDPAHIGNVGSFFKNPVVDAAAFAGLIAAYPDMPHYAQADGSVKLAAGWLIERSGWKGRQLGAVGTYPRQALVLVNRGGACGRDVLRLAAAIGDEVEARFGIRLEAEPVIV